MFSAILALPVKLIALYKYYAQAFRNIFSGNKVDIVFQNNLLSVFFILISNLFKITINIAILLK